MFYALLLIAALMIAVEVLAAKTNRRIRRKGLASPKWEKAYQWRWVFGIPSAVLSAFVFYPMPGVPELSQVMGFPLMVAAFDEAGHDYVGPFTVPSFFANIAIWYFLPQVALLVWAKIVEPSNEKA